MFFTVCEKIYKQVTREGTWGAGVELEVSMCMCIYVCTYLHVFPNSFCWDGLQAVELQHQWLHTEYSDPGI